MQILTKAGEKMKILDIFKRSRAAPQMRATPDDVLLQALLNGENVSTERAMEIPAVASSINLICDTVAMIPVKLYREEIIKEKPTSVEVTEDDRTSLINDDTKDTLDGVQFKRAIVRDYLLQGNAYAYINKRANRFRSVNYVSAQNVGVIPNQDPIFKRLVPQ
jgi:phage portal protein BeeE